MEPVDFALFKAHVCADDLSADDALLAEYLAAATAKVVQDTCRTEAELLAEGDGKLPAPLKQAVLLLGGHWYNQREAVAGVQMHSVPLAYDALVRPYRRLSRREGAAL